MFEVAALILSISIGLLVLAFTVILILFIKDELF